LKVLPQVIDAATQEPFDVSKNVTTAYTSPLDVRDLVMAQRSTLRLLDIAVITNSNTLSARSFVFDPLGNIGLGFLFSLEVPQIAGGESLEGLKIVEDTSLLAAWPYYSFFLLRGVGGNVRLYVTPPDNAPASSLYTFLDREADKDWYTMAIEPTSATLKVIVGDHGSLNLITINNVSKVEQPPYAILVPEVNTTTRTRIKMADDYCVCALFTNNKSTPVFIDITASLICFDIRKPDAYISVLTVVRPVLPFFDPTFWLPVWTRSMIRNTTLP